MVVSTIKRIEQLEDLLGIKFTDEESDSMSLECEMDDDSFVMTKDDEIFFCLAGVVSRYSRHERGGVVLDLLSPCSVSRYDKNRFRIAPKRLLTRR
jgi:hypothetical protein